MVYSHFLSLQVVDSEKNVLENQELLEHIKSYITDKAILQKVPIFDGQISVDYFIIWERPRWLSPYNNVVSEFATKSHNRSDLMVYDHTTITMERIEQKIKEDESEKYGKEWNIVWYITRALNDLY
jgi:hypothetical protein